MDNTSKYILKLDNIVYDLNLFSTIREISLNVDRGSNVVIFGVENSGIDLLCSIISGIERNYRGNVFYNEENILSHDPAKINHIRKSLAYMQRTYGLIRNMNVEENIALPLRYHTKMSMKDIEDKVDSIIDDLNLEYCRLLRPVNLRRSELLKASYARSIALNPDLLLVEHPLEAQCTMDTLVFLEKLVERENDPERSTVIVTYHPWRFINASNRFVMLDSGKIVFDGNRNEFIDSGNEYLKQYRNNDIEGPLQII